MTWNIRNCFYYMLGWAKSANEDEKRIWEKLKQNDHYYYTHIDKIRSFFCFTFMMNMKTLIVDQRTKDTLETHQMKWPFQFESVEPWSLNSIHTHTESTVFRPKFELITIFRIAMVTFQSSNDFSKLAKPRENTLKWVPCKMANTTISSVSKFIFTPGLIVMLTLYIES